MLDAAGELLGLARDFGLDLFALALAALTGRVWSTGFERTAGLTVDDFFVESLSAK